MTTHTLKCWTQYYTATVDRFEKLFECRLNDREFQKGDTVILLGLDNLEPLPGFEVRVAA